MLLYVTSEQLAVLRDDHFILPVMHAPFIFSPFLPHEAWHVVIDMTCLFGPSRRFSDRSNGNCLRLVPRDLMIADQRRTQFVKVALPLCFFCKTNGFSDLCPLDLCMRGERRQLVTFYRGINLYVANVMGIDEGSDQQEGLLVVFTQELGA